MSEQQRPRVLFVCVRNGGKSPMAAGLLDHVAGGSIEALSAGTDPGTKVNALSAEVLAEVDVDISGHQPRPVTDQLLRSVDRVVLLGSEVSLDVPLGTVVENWMTDEPSERGIDGIERMRLVRDDIASRVQVLADQLTAGEPQRPVPRGGS